MSAEVLHNYENVPEKPGEWEPGAAAGAELHPSLRLSLCVLSPEEQEYLNVEPPMSEGEGSSDGGPEAPHPEAASGSRLSSNAAVLSPTSCLSSGSATRLSTLSDSNDDDDDDDDEGNYVNVHDGMQADSGWRT